jgi:hypothetical protein
MRAATLGSPQHEEELVTGQRLLRRLGTLVLSAALLTSAAVAVPAPARATNPCADMPPLCFEVNAIGKMWWLTLLGAYTDDQVVQMRQQSPAAFAWLVAGDQDVWSPAWGVDALVVFEPLAAVSAPVAPAVGGVTPAHDKQAATMEMICASFAGGIALLVAARLDPAHAPALRAGAVKAFRDAALIHAQIVAGKV